MWLEEMYRGSVHSCWDRQADCIATAPFTTASPCNTTQLAFIALPCVAKLKVKALSMPVLVNHMVVLSTLCYKETQWWV